MSGVPGIVDLYRTDDLVTREEEQRDVGIASIESVNWCKGAVACQRTIDDVSIQVSVLMSYLDVCWVLSN
jgi:hypothetical protein